MEYFDKDDYAYLTTLYTNQSKNLSRWIWRNNLSDSEIELWLQNFDGSVDNNITHEQLNSLFLLKQYMFFDIVEVRELLSALYRIHFYKYSIHNLRKKHLTSDLDRLGSLYQEELNLTRFLGIGNPSESSGLLLYFFRQINDLSTNLFWNVKDIFTFDEQAKVSGLHVHKYKKDSKEYEEKIRNYIFIDDLAATGSQATDFFSTDTSIDICSKINEYNPDAKIFYFTIFNTELSKEKFIEEGLGNVIIKSIFELDSTYKVYTNQSRYFPENPTQQGSNITERDYSKQICDKYFHKLYMNRLYKYGYDNSQLLLSFFYNTPDNTIPLFWAESSLWNTIFKRYMKK